MDGSCLLSLAQMTASYASISETNLHCSHLVNYKAITVLQYFSENRICDGFQVDVAIVRQIIEDVGSTHSLRTSLPISEDEINPMMQLNGYNL